MDEAGRAARMDEAGRAARMDEAVLGHVRASRR